jgi:hypothetical protein
VNNEVLTVIGTGPITAEGWLRLVGSIAEMGINQIYGTCTDLYDDDIIPSMLCAGVPDGGEARRVDFSESGSAEQEVSDRSCLVVF